MKNTLKLSDNVISRLAQILQEGLLMGIDVVDLMRTIELEVAPGNMVDLTVEYMQSVKDGHQRMLDTLEQKLASNSQEQEKTGPRIITNIS